MVAHELRRPLTDRVQAERAFVLAKRLGSINAARAFAYRALGLLEVGAGRSRRRWSTSGPCSTPTAPSTWGSCSRTLPSS
jgi:hypothetical protein